MPDLEYLPFKAINVFIEREDLEKVVRDVLEGIEELSKQEQAKFSSFFRKNVNILGFRNPVRAPLSLQVNAYASAFEENDDVIPYTLTMWTQLNKNFAEQVRNWLEAEGWKNLSFQRDFDEADGFVSDWPQGLTFEELNEKFKKDNPDVDFDPSDLLLMVMWISGRLPKEQSDL